MLHPGERGKRATRRRQGWASIPVVSSRSTSGGFTIVVQGDVGAHLIAAFEELSIERTGPETVLRLRSTDSEQLRKTLERLGDAGITVIALKQVDGST